ncbi:MAG: dTDP-4-dehydrorhamnose reductase [Segetibacter sp.]|nr:dTDP-4-dehydrorhamnose reductase [Segetibacter sp.]
MNNKISDGLELWGGIECTINRVNDTYMDQLDLAGHYNRPEDITRFAELGIKALRYPIIWEKHQPGKDDAIDWKESNDRLEEIKRNGIKPIVGLVHHGSGPLYVDFFDNSFATGLANYAAKVAVQFPWVEYYTPVNEPLTTARFCGLYGHWYPHEKSNFSFLKILIAECKATVLAMQAIRKINPAAKLVQTEDLGKTHSTPTLSYQAEFENHRRWLSFDLLCGKVDETYALWKHIIGAGVKKEDLVFFLDNPCPPDILGINHYITSERFLDERIDHYPAHTIGGNGQHTYADVEAVRMGKNVMAGPEGLLQEAWDRYKLPIAVTEVHLHCTREEQLRWFFNVYKAAKLVKEKGANIVAVTAWAILGSFDWCSLLTKRCGVYEAGVFDIRSIQPRPTALTKLVSTLAHGNDYYHPVLEENGWWKRSARIIYFPEEEEKMIARPPIRKTIKPLLIIGKTGTLGKAFSRICKARAIVHISLGREDLDICNQVEIEKVFKQYSPWAVINTTGYVKVDEAENDRDNCFLINSAAPAFMAAVCERLGIQFVTFSSDLVFDGKKNNPYIESDSVGPLNVYGQSKVRAEEAVLKTNPSALILRTSAFFGPWDSHNFVYFALKSLKNQQELHTTNDVIISPTYVPDLVNTSLDLLIDEACGIWNLSNDAQVSWAMLASQVAERIGSDKSKVRQLPLADMKWLAPRPAYSVLNTEKGFRLPSLDDALGRYFYEQEMITV